MTPPATRISAVATALAVCLAFAPAAQAGTYAGNKCVAKKEGALGKYAKAVTAAWDKNPGDPTGREADIATAKTKLDDSWSKSEEKTALKGSSCDESTSTTTEAATVVNDAVTSVAGESTHVQLTDYIADAMKAYGKYIKAPGKDPGKVTLTAALGTAATDNLTGASGAVMTAASTLQADLIELTTTAPDYPYTIQAISPTVCGGGVCGGSAQACATNGDCTTLPYAKQQLSPTCVDGDPYMYFARKGTSNNLLMYYQGGGACWSDDSCFGIPGGGSICARTVDASDNPDTVSTGFADYANPSNPFHDWNVVFVSYCTCDVHWGDEQHNYAPGVFARHRGRTNAAIAEKFAREHFLDPDQVFVTGSSAGSYGAIMNSYYLMKNVWPNADFSVLGDAGVGVITQQWLDLYIQNWGLEANFPEDLPGVALPVTDLSLVDLIDGLAAKFPNARFGNYDSSYDGGGGSQSNFFQVMRHPTPKSDILSDWPNYWESACDWNACMRDFKAQNATDSSNYRYFTGAGSRHTIFGSDKIYTETKSTTVGGLGVTFADWVSAMVGNTPAWVNVDCNNPGGDCNLTNTCQGGSNPGGFCSQKCSGGLNDGLDCANAAEDCGAVCVGGDNNGLPCTSNASCNVPDPGIDGICSASCVSSNADCPGGICELDPDTSNAPYAGNDTVTCAPTTCPCGSTNGECFDGSNEGASCTSDANCTGVENGSCSWVRCPAP